MKIRNTQFSFFTFFIILAFSVFLSKSGFSADIQESTAAHTFQVAQADEISSLLDDDEYDDEDEDMDDEEFDDENEDEDVITDDETGEDGLMDNISIHDEETDDENQEEDGDSYVADTLTNSPTNIPCKPSECMGKVIFRIDSKGILPGTTCLKPGAIIEVINDTNYPARAYFEPLGLTNYGELYLMAKRKGQVTAGTTPMNGKMTVITEAPGNPGKLYTRSEHDIIICPIP